MVAYLPAGLPLSQFGLPVEKCSVRVLKQRMPYWTLHSTRLCTKPDNTDTSQLTPYSIFHFVSFIDKGIKKPPLPESREESYSSTCCTFSFTNKKTDQVGDNPGQKNQAKNFTYPIKRN